MKYKVLLIDDEPSSLEGLLLWIDWEALGFEICGTCENGREGLQQMRLLQPDLVITDVNMPVMNGLEMVAAWRQEEPEAIRFAILSGYSEFEYAQAAIRHGIHHYLLKPIFPEEAAEELQEIYEELEQGRRKAMMNQIASLEETATQLKALMQLKPEDKGEPELPAGLPEGMEAWNVILFQTVPDLHPELRGSAAALAAGQAAMYLIDLDASSFAIVYGAGDHSREAEAAEAVRTPLQQSYADQPLLIAAGAAVSSPLHLADSYHTAKEALMHFFYQPEPYGFLAYQDIQDRPFSYHYDHIRLMDAIMGPVNTLDLEGFRHAAAAAARSFRDQRIAPEVVKKLVIHIMYRIFELTPEEGGGRKSALPGGIGAAEIPQNMISLTGLMDRLLMCGEAGIDLLIQEQDRNSYGIVRKINQYIEEHYRESLTIQKLAEIFYLHPVYLGQLLRKKNGIHFHEQLHNLRIEEAAAMLRQNTYKISEIAEQVGYSNYGQFLKQFERKKGMGPGHYRNGKF
ncbi:response regulator [Paenibacillus sp. HW567]|uniref:response regulator n=1 Tax=Paenibacillus sp. HW567 TaxID=1034769 RepID=UPI000367577F|nr:response regulator [Paenibacillus sp. HW567]